MGFRVISLDALDVSNRNATVLATGKRVESVLASLGIDDNSKQVARAMLAAKKSALRCIARGRRKIAVGPMSYGGFRSSCWASRSRGTCRYKTYLEREKL